MHWRRLFQRSHLWPSPRLHIRRDEKIRVKTSKEGFWECENREGPSRFDEKIYGERRLPPAGTELNSNY